MDYNIVCVLRDLSGCLVYMEIPVYYLFTLKDNPTFC